jgi:hypothetical protein
LSDGFIVIAAFHDNRLLRHRGVALEFVQAVIWHEQPLWADLDECVERTTESEARQFLEIASSGKRRGLPEVLKMAAYVGAPADAFGEGEWGLGVGQGGATAADWARELDPPAHILRT